MILIFLFAITLAQVVSCLLCFLQALVFTALHPRCLIFASYIFSQLYVHIQCMLLLVKVDQACLSRGVS